MTRFREIIRQKFQQVKAKHLIDHEGVLLEGSHHRSTVDAEILGASLTKNFQKKKTLTNGSPRPCVHRNQNLDFMVLMKEARGPRNTPPKINLDTVKQDFSDTRNNLICGGESDRNLGAGVGNKSVGNIHVGHTSRSERLIKKHINFMEKNMPHCGFLHKRNRSADNFHGGSNIFMVSRKELPNDKNDQVNNQTNCDRSNRVIKGQLWQKSNKKLTTFIHDKWKSGKAYKNPED